jgi:hypothetical protein
MLTLITGQPGAGKTLYMLTAVKAEADKAKRPVYYAGVRGLNRELLDWIELDDMREWHKVPDGSIVVLDECQTMWRTRGVGSHVPDYVAAMETHRHRGIDVWATTQHPMLLDSNIRRLVGRHLHVMRNFGMHKATIHEWSTLRAEPDKTRTDSIRHDFIYPKASFELYQSAEIHTHKRSIPPRVFFLVGAPFLLAGLAYLAYIVLRPYSDGSNLKKAEISSSQSAQGTPGASGSLDGRAPRVMSLPQYLDHHKPRIGGLAYTAPAYDEITKPVRAPYPAAAVMFKGSCRAYTQQGTRLEVPQEVCQHIVRTGFFMAWDDKPLEHSPGANKTTQEATNENG